MALSQPTDPVPQDGEKVSDNNDEDKIVEKARKRRKRIFNEIREQMEFYFSDSNLRNSQYMRQLMMRSAAGEVLTGNEPVPLSEIMGFNKMRSLSTSEEEVRRALRSSAVLLVTGPCVSRKQPVDFTKNVDACTLYVENLPNDVTHDWLKKQFEQCGVVNYISIPKFENKRPKGFAFIEFSSESAVRDACRTFSDPILTDKDFEPNIDAASTLDQHSKAAGASKKRKPAAFDECEDHTRKKVSFEADQGREQEEHLSGLSFHTDATQKLQAIEQNIRVMPKEEWMERRKKRRQIQATKKKLLKSCAKSDEQPEPAVPSAIALKLANLINPSPIPMISDKITSSDMTYGTVLRLAIRKKMSDTFEESITKRSIREAADPIRLAYVDVDAQRTTFHEDQTATYICFIRCFSHSDADQLCSQNTLCSLGVCSKLSQEEEDAYQRRIRESRELLKQKRENKSRKGTTRK